MTAIGEPLTRTRARCLLVWPFGSVLATTQSFQSPGILGTGSSKVTGTGESLARVPSRAGTDTLTELLEISIQQ